MPILGMGLVPLEVVFFPWAWNALRANYSGHSSMKNRQTLAQGIPYRFIRHPAYAGFLWMALGISLGYASLVGLISFFALLLPSQVYRIKVVFPARYPLCVTT